MTSRVSLSAYRGRAGREADVLPHLREEIVALRSRGHVTRRPAAICRTPGGLYLVVFEWASERSVDDAHADEVILEVWRRKERILEYLAPSELDTIDAPFASFDVVEDA